VGGRKEKEEGEKVPPEQLNILTSRGLVGKGPTGG
jgi:hypothetical protein